MSLESPPPPIAPAPSRWAFALVAAVVAGLLGTSACIIGPKQDDPEADIDRGLDASTGADTSDMSDTSPAAFTETGSTDTETPPSPPDADAATDGADDAPRIDAGCDADAGDACAPGGADALTAD